MSKLSRHPNDLSIHPALRGLPELAEDDPQFIAGVESVSEHGLFDRIKIDEKDQIVDGRHRNRWARKAGLKEVEVELVSEDEVEAIILESLLARRHYSPSARAYMALPLLEAAAAEGTLNRRKNAGRPRKNNSTDTVGRISESPVLALASRVGVSRDLLELARIVAAIFAKQEEIIAVWLERFDCADAVTMWAAWDQTRPDAWTSFSRQWISRQADMVDDDPTYEPPPDPPESWKEEFEAKLFASADGISLGGIRQALAGRVATRGKGRADLKAKDVAELLNLAQKRIKNLTSAWNKWDALQAEDRMQTIQVLTVEAQNWPKDVRAALKRSL